MSPQKNNFLRGLSRFITDFLAAVFAWGTAYLLRFIESDFTTLALPPFEDFQFFVVLSAVLLVIVFAPLRLYSSYPKAFYISSSIVREVLIGVCLWALVLVAIYSLVFHQLFFSRMMLMNAVIFTFFYTLLFRVFLFFIWEHVWIQKRIALVKGTADEKMMLENALKNSSFSLVSEVTPMLTDVFFFEGSHDSSEIRAMREWCAEHGKTLFLIPAYASDFWGHASFEMIRGIPMICASPTPPQYWWFFWKRIFDIIFSLFFLLLFSPLFFIVSICIWLESKGPVFYVSQRVGKNGKLFSLIKFRSMHVDAEKQKAQLEKFSHRDGPFFKVKNDPRITKIGKFLRKTSIDEFPNFINVLLGDMSVIGPRPHLPTEVEKYSSNQKRVLSVRPGISGLAQVSGRSDLSFEQEMMLETFYTENIGFWLDMKIFIKTPFVLLAGKGAD